MSATTLLDAVEDAIVVVGPDLTVRYGNRAARRIATGVVRQRGTERIDVGDELAGVSAAEVIHPDDLEDAFAVFLHTLETPGRKGVVRVRLRTVEGWHPVEATISNHLDDPGLGGAVLCFRDLSREEELRQSLEQRMELDRRNRALRSELQERQRFLSRLVRIQSSISRRAPLDDVFDAIVHGAAQLFGDVSVLLRLQDPGDARHLVLTASHGVEVGDELRTIAVDRGLAGEAHASNRTVATSHYGSMATARAGYADTGIRAGMATPVRSNGRPIGTIEVTSSERRRFSTTEQEMLEVFAEHAGIALMDAHARESVRLALTDPLTGLPNRRLFVDRLATDLDEPSSTPLAVLFVDLDGFKAVNDSRGHATGDQVLIEVARRIEGALADGDTAARLGGDEFVVALTRCDRIRAEQVALEISERIRSPYRLGRRSFYVGSTIGVVLVDDVRQADAETLLRLADIAMYRGKRDGRNRVVFFDPAMEEAIIARSELESQLRHAIRTESIDVAYQPVIDLMRRRVVGLEALARWSSPTQGPIAPTVFVQLAEELGLVAELDRVVLAQACRDTRDVLDPVTGRPLRLAVNLSPKHLDVEDAVDRLILEVDRAEFDPRRLTLEVTETDAMRDPVLALEQIDRLRALGIAVAIDDFGTGYSSLAYLEQFPVDVVKIDQKFVGRIEHPGQGRDLLRSMGLLVRSLGLASVAEGVETVRQATQLQAMGIDQAQGYHFGRPTPIGDLHDELERVPERLLALSATDA